MKLFLDTADVAAIARFSKTGLLDGVTTNPTHLSNAGGNPGAQVREIAALLPRGDVSVEVTETEPNNVYEQAKKIAEIADNISVKIPCHADYYDIIHRLVSEGVKINVTLVFTLAQSLFMCKLGVRYISPFVGRLDDIEEDGVKLLYEIRAMIDFYGYETQLLAASLRHTRHFHDAILAGADVATLPIKLFEQVITHPLTDRGMEQFNADWQKLGVRQFP